MFLWFLMKIYKLVIFILLFIDLVKFNYFFDITQIEVKVRINIKNVDLFVIF